MVSPKGEVIQLERKKVKKECKISLFILSSHNGMPTLSRGKSLIYPKLLTFPQGVNLETYRFDTNVSLPPVPFPGAA